MSQSRHHSSSFSLRRRQNLFPLCLSLLLALISLPVRSEDDASLSRHVDEASSNFFPSSASATAAASSSFSRSLVGKPPPSPSSMVVIPDNVTSIPGNEPTGGMQQRITWYKLREIPQCAGAEVVSMTASVHPMHTFNGVNNSVVLIGGVRRPMANLPIKPDGDNVFFGTAITSYDAGLSWTCVPIDTSVTRLEAASVSFIYPPIYPAQAPYTPSPYVAPTEIGLLLQDNNREDSTHPHCSLLCLLGGLIVDPDPASSFGKPVYPLHGYNATDEVLCSRDQGMTWFQAAPLPTVMTRATAQQFGADLLVIGGIRVDGGAGILRAVMNLTECSINGWEDYATASPMTDRFDVVATQVWNNATGELELWAGGGKTNVGGGPLRSLEVWYSSTPTNRSSWTRLSGLIPTSIAMVTGDEGEPTSYFADLRAVDGRIWALNHGACVESEFDGSCFPSMLLLNGDYAYVHIRGLVSGWSGAITIINYAPPPTGIVVGPPIIHRRPIFTHDVASLGSPPVAVALDSQNGIPWRVYSTPCYDSCPSGWWTPGCRLSPHDAMCQRCRTCPTGEYLTTPCGAGVVLGYSDTQCSSCRICNPGEQMVSDCNATHNRVCALAAPRPPPSDALVFEDSSLMGVYAAALCCAFASVLATAAIACFRFHPFAVLASVRRSPDRKAAMSMATLGYLALMRGGWKEIWPVAATFSHVACYSALAASFATSSLKLGLAVASISASLAFAPLLNIPVFFYVARRSRHSADGEAVDAWRPISARSWLVAVLAFIHPRVALLLAPSSKSTRRSGGGAAAAASGSGAGAGGGNEGHGHGHGQGAGHDGSRTTTNGSNGVLARIDPMTSRRFSDVLLWVLIASLFLDVPPLMACLFALNAFSMAQAAPAVVLCILLGALNLFTTLAWTMKVYVRSGSLSKLTQSSSSSSRKDPAGGRAGGHGHGSSSNAARLSGVEVVTIEGHGPRAARHMGANPSSPAFAVGGGVGDMESSRGGQEGADVSLVGGGGGGTRDESWSSTALLALPPAQLMAVLRAKLRQGSQAAGSSSEAGLDPAQAAELVDLLEGVLSSRAQVGPGGGGGDRSGFDQRWQARSRPQTQQRNLNDLPPDEADSASNVGREAPVLEQRAIVSSPPPRPLAPALPRGAVVAGVNASGTAAGPRALAASAAAAAAGSAPAAAVPAAVPAAPPAAVPAAVSAAPISALASVWGGWGVQPADEMARIQRVLYSLQHDSDTDSRSRSDSASENSASAPHVPVPASSASSSASSVCGGPSGQLPGLPSVASPSDVGGGSGAATALSPRHMRVAAATAHSNRNNNNNNINNNNPPA